METKNHPAFPPQVAQDNLGRLIAPIPGMSKLEFFAIMLLPKYIDLSLQKNLTHDGINVNPYQAAVIAAEKLISEIQKAQPHETVISE